MSLPPGFLVLIAGAILSAGSARADSCADELVAARRDARVIRVFEAPTGLSPYAAHYVPTAEIVLRPGESVVFAVPESMRGQAVESVILRHRQDPALTRGGDPRDYLVWDDFPAYTSVQVLSSDPARGWRYWGGPASAERGAKFAEVRSSPEEEKLYEWRRYGDRSVARPAEAPRHDGVRACLARIVASGVDPVSFAGLGLRVQAPRPRRFDERIYTPGTAFGDFETARGRSYGGGEEYRGAYPGALILRAGGGGAIVPAGGDWTAKGATLRIPLAAGQALASVEVALGDARGWDEAHGTYWRGGGRISLRIVRADGRTEALVEDENVGPEGVISGYAYPRAARSGDYLELRCLRDQVSVMGVRVGWN